MILKTQDKMNRVYSQNLLVFDFASTDREKERKNLMIEKSNTAIPVAENRQPVHRFALLQLQQCLSL